MLGACTVRANPCVLVIHCFKMLAVGADAVRLSGLSYCLRGHDPMGALVQDPAAPFLICFPAKAFVKTAEHGPRA